MIRLFCFTYGGGTSAVFKDWQQQLSNRFKVIPIEYPGHGKKYAEKLTVDLKSLVDNLFQEIKSQLQPPYCLFGHSLGATIAFELAHKIEDEKISPPFYLIVSGSGAPQFPDPLPAIGHLTDDEFLDEVQSRYQGFHADILAQHELMEVLLPIIRADFIMSEQYQFDRNRPLSCPILAIVGTNDTLIDPKEILGWQEQTKNTFNSIYLPGDHLSIVRSPSLLLEVIAKTLPDL